MSWQKSHLGFENNLYVFQRDRLDDDTVFWMKTFRMSREKIDFTCGRIKILFFKIIFFFLINIVQTAFNSVVPRREGEKHQNVLFISAQGILPSLFPRTQAMCHLYKWSYTPCTLWEMEWKTSIVLQNIIG